MSKIKSIRPVLLSAPYADTGTNAEVLLHLSAGYRTTGMVEIQLEDGTTGLGEGYLAVFEQLIHLARPYLIGREIMDLNRIYADLLIVYGYWSMQGAAMHALSAIEIALQDCRAKVLGRPLYQVLGGALTDSLKLYGSGGDSLGPAAMKQEFIQLEELGIKAFKIRARKEQIRKAVWCLRQGDRRGISVAVDMGQNLLRPGQTMMEVLSFADTVQTESHSPLFFLEEVLGPTRTQEYPLLRQKINTPIAGGEIVTTAEELGSRMASECYDIVQPDATVIGGIRALMQVFQISRLHAAEVVVHCWGGPVGMMANYHAALAGGGKLAEWPMPAYPLREALLRHPWQIDAGQLYLSDEPGLGVHLSPEIEARFAFRPEAVYHCLADRGLMPDDEIWK